MLLTAVMPQLAVADYTLSDKPTNLSPYNGATEIGPSHVFEMLVPDPGPDEYIAKQVQYRTPEGTYDLPLFDSGFVLADTDEVYPAGAFDYGETYYWRVRVQDDLGYWSGWSDETSFTVVTNSPPSQPENFEPDDSATGVSLPVTLQACEFRDPNASDLVLGEADTHAASQWQVTATSDNYVSPAFDSGRVTAGLTSVSVPVGNLAENTKYFWHVRYQDSYGNWSAYSPETSFTTGTTTAVVAIQQPVNVSPFSGATDISPDQKLKASAFQGAAGRTHFASRWQVASSAGAYSSSLFDSGIDPNNKLEIAMPVGLLDYEKTYYWHVKYQDDTGAWSAWSEETSFTVVGNLPPSQPRNLEPLDEKTGVVVIPVLKASDFSDPDTSAYTALTDSHAASQWQVTGTAGNYSDNVCVWNSGVASPTTSAIVPDSAALKPGIKYFWHVRYQDSHENWSGYSAETSFTTKALSAPVASFSADKTEVTAGTELVTFTDNSTQAGEIKAWHWDFGDGTTENWTTLTRPSNGQISHKYVDGDTYTVSLTVSLTEDYAAGTINEKVKDAYVLAHAKPEAKIVGPASAKAGQEFTFTDDSTPREDITSWEWQFDDGTTEQWTERPADGQITHVFKKAGQHTVSLTVGGELGESYYNKQINVTGGGGFRFGLWMIGVALAAVVVVAGVVYLLRARKGK